MSAHARFYCPRVVANLLKLSLASMSIDVIKDLEMSTSGSSDENEPPSPEYPGDNGDTPCTSGTHHRK